MARALSALGSVKSELGEYDEALALLERAKAMKAAAAREAPTGASVHVLSTPGKFLRLFRLARFFIPIGMHSQTLRSRLSQ